MFEFLLNLNNFKQIKIRNKQIMKTKTKQKNKLNIKFV